MAVGVYCIVRPPIRYNPRPSASTKLSLQARHQDLVVGPVENFARFEIILGVGTLLFNSTSKLTSPSQAIAPTVSCQSKTYYTLKESKKRTIPLSIPLWPRIVPIYYRL